MSDSPGLVGFGIGQVNSVINLPNGQVKFLKEFKLRRNCEINLLIKTFLGLAEIMFGLVNISFSLPEWQAVKVTFFTPWSVSLCGARRKGMGKEGKSQRGEKGMDACNKNPLLFISVAAGICNLLIGWATLSNLLTCVKIVRNNHDAGIKRTVVYWNKLRKIKIYADEVVTSHSNLLHFSLPFLFFVPATQAISVPQCP